MNAVVGGYLRDLAFAQPSQQKMFGYKRAAAAILALEVPLTDLLGADGALPPVSSSMLRPPSLMPGSPAFRRTASSTAGLSTVCSRGFAIPPRERLVPPTSAAHTATHPRGRYALQRDTF